MINGAWDMECDRQFFVILGHFLPFYPTDNSENENFEKMKQATGDIIILHKCIKNYDHTLCCSWDMAGDGFNFYFLSCSIFSPFTPLTTQKIKIFKNWKK